MSTDADACDCTRGLYGHRKRVCTTLEADSGERRRSVWGGGGGGEMKLVPRIPRVDGSGRSGRDCHHDWSSAQIAWVQARLEPVFVLLSTGTGRPECLISRMKIHSIFDP